MAQSEAHSFPQSCWSQVSLAVFSDFALPAPRRLLRGHPASALGMQELFLGGRWELLMRAWPLLPSLGETSQPSAVDLGSEACRLCLRKPCSGKLALL